MSSILTILVPLGGAVLVGLVDGITHTTSLMTVSIILVNGFVAVVGAIMYKKEV